MGLDYSHVLRFRREQLKEILLAVVERAKPNSDPPVEVSLPVPARVLALHRFGRCAIIVVLRDYSSTVRAAGLTQKT